MFEYNIGVREHYEYKDAMFVNSLFKDYLLENSLQVWNNESTRDIICIEFNYGSRSYNEEIEHLFKIAWKTNQDLKKAICNNDEFLINKAKNTKVKINELLYAARKNKYKFVKLSKDELRKKFYNEGVNVEYIFRKRNGEIKKTEVIHYKMLYRSTGKAKKGSCMFIRDSLFYKAKNFLYMGINLPYENSKIVEVSAYAPLVSSGIVDRIKINPKNILILKDIKRFFKTNVITIETDKNKQCIANNKKNYNLYNTLFDGQALIDSSIFPEWANGYILLRHHFCKMAAFNTNIQKFFKDYFKENYYTATVKDMFGNIHYVKDIELITTDNAMKWLKMNVDYDYWCDWVYSNDCNFGIVKTAHKSKLGDVQKMSYQMVNSLSIDIMDNVMQETIKYIKKLKDDHDFFLKYLEQNKNFSNDFDVLIELCKHNSNFYRSSYFKLRKKKIIENYILDVKSGKIIQNAENLTVVGSPYAMLLYAASGNEQAVDLDDTFNVENGTVQCYTERFPDNDYLAFFRSPFNSKNNLSYFHNVYSEHMKKYFKLGNLCIAVNMNGTDFQDRNNGLDQDSDFGFTTNQPDIVKYAYDCYTNYATIVNLIPKEANVYHNTMNDYANMDNALAASQTDIGESSNLAQLAQTYACTFNSKKYDNYVCILSVIAQVAIDNAKRKFDLDISKEIKRIKKDMDISKHKYPLFWKLIKRGFNDNNINKYLKCPMNYLYNLTVTGDKKNQEEILDMSYFYIQHSLEKDKKQCKKVEELIENYSLGLLDCHINSNEYNYDDYLLLRSDFDVLISDIKKTYISSNYSGLMSWLINRAFYITPKILEKKSQVNSKLCKNKSLLIKTLYTVSKKSFLSCFKKE